MALEKSSNFDLQSNIFNYILSEYKSPKEAVKELCQVLNVSQSSVYKRIQGSKLINSKEIDILIDRYSIPLTSLFQSSGSNIIFDYEPLMEFPQLTGSYLSGVINDLKLVASDPKGRILYVSTDLPFFYYFLHKEIAWFKLYLFQNNNSDMSISQLPKISFSAIGEKEKQLFDAVKILYSRIDSEEIWTSRVFKITIDQIKYFLDVNLFQNVEDALLLMEKIEDSVDLLLEIVNKNNKGLMINKVTQGGKLNLSYNDFNRFNPTIIACTQETESLYLTYNLPHYLYTKDQRFIDYTKNWIERIKRKSFPVSENADIEQVNFFNMVKSYIRKEKSLMKEKLAKNR